MLDVDALRHSHQLFSHVGTISCLPALKSTKLRIKNLLHGHNTVTGETWTSNQNPSIPSLLLYQLSRCALRTTYTYCLFVFILLIRPINNLSVIKGRVFLVWTSTKPGLMLLLKDTTQWRLWGSNPRPLCLESSTLPLSHCAPTYTHILAYKYSVDIWRVSPGNGFWDARRAFLTYTCL